MSYHIHVTEQNFNLTVSADKDISRSDAAALESP